MFGWNGFFLNINLTNSKFSVESYGADFASSFIGGRGFAAKILWDKLQPRTDPFSPQNLLIFAAGPLTGYPLPNSGKLVVAVKKPVNRRVRRRQHRHLHCGYTCAKQATTPSLSKAKQRNPQLCTSKMKKWSS